MFSPEYSHGKLTRAATCVVLLALLSCSDTEDMTRPEAPHAASLSISPATIVLGGPGATAELRPTVLDQYGNPFTEAVAWSSGDAAVVSVDQGGGATAVSTGSATIQVVSGDLIATVEVSVDASAAAGVCDRTPQVRDALTAAASRSDCSQVSAGLLSRIRRLDLRGPDAPDSTETAGDCAEELREEPGQGETRACESGSSGRNGRGNVFQDMANADGETGQITSLGSGDFQGLGSLHTLLLSWNALRTLPDSSFSDLVSLDTLNLEENRLASLPAGVFESLTGLEYLDLSDNALTVLPESSFAGLSSLGSLFLDDNWFPALPNGIFDDLTALDTLWLEDNELRALPDGVFSNLADLEALDLSGNRLATLPESVFHSLVNLEFLTLSGNNLTELRAGVFDSLSAVKNLYFSSNRLATLPEGVFDNLTAVNDLSIGRNRLTELPESVFAGLASLDSLSMTRNRLTELDEDVFDGLTDLDVLSFSFNQLTEVPAGLLDDLGDLTTLFMTGNRLTKLPDGIFRDTPDLELLSLYSNSLTELPRGVFAGMAALETLWLEDNLVDPLPLTLEAIRTDNDDPLAEGPAEIAIAVREGAPFDMRVVFGARGSVPPSTVASIAAGDTLSRVVTVNRREGSVFQYVVVDSLPATPTDLCNGNLCFEGMSPVSGNPLVLVNPPDLKVEAKAAYLVQAAQSYAGKVPLVADRQALLRVFVTADYTNAYRPAARATFFLGEEEIHVASLEAPSGLPGRVDESSLASSFNAIIPGSVVQPGVEMVVEIDPDSTLSTTTGSQLRIPATGRRALDVRTLPPLDVTLVPVAFSSEVSKGDNEMVAALVRDMATNDSRATLQPARALLPLTELNVRLREPYATQADTLEDGGIGLLDEIHLLRFIEAGATDEYYHGILAWPASRYPGSWGYTGIAYIGGWAGLTLSHIGGVYRTGFPDTFAHELGHNLSLRHAPGCGAGGPDPAYPYDGAFTGVWGVDFDTGGEFGRLISPARYRDFMSYCDPAWTSDFNFTKAIEYREQFVVSAAADGGMSARKTLLVWGRVLEDGGLILEPVFEWEAPVKLPTSPGPYRLEGVDGSGGRMFSLSFTPDQVDHGGAGFLFAVPVEEGWADELNRVTLTGPEGFTNLDRDNGGRGVIVTSRETGRIRSIIRDWSGTLPASLGTAGEVSISRSVLVREVRERER